METLDLRVTAINRQTEDAVEVVFDIDASGWKYQSGQYITICKDFSGEELRRAYSISSAPYENKFAIAVKEVEGGKMSTFLNRVLKVGDVLKVMPPQGKFVLAGDEQYVVAFSAGSGITPIISMLKSSIKTNPQGVNQLFYWNKNAESIIFKEELEQLTVSNERFLQENFYSQKEGRINKAKLQSIILSLVDADVFSRATYILCGPQDMVMLIKEGLMEAGIAEAKIKFELFTVAAPETKEPSENAKITAEITAIVDGDEFAFSLASDGDYILDAAIDNGADAPYSCKGAVCCTCKAQVLEGKVSMDMNYSLTEDEVADGMVLTCQARPQSEKVVIDFDVI